MLLYIVKIGTMYARHLLILKMFVLTHRIRLQLCWCMLTKWRWPVTCFHTPSTTIITTLCLIPSILYTKF